MRAHTLLLVLLLGASACSRSKMADYYVLTSQPFEPRAGSAGPSIGIGPVLLPKYADRLNIVTTGGPQRVEMTEQHLWAEPPVEAMTRVLAENLSALLATDRVHVQPWPQGAVDYRIGVNVLRLTGKLGGQAEVQALWTVEAGDKIVVARRTNLQRPAGESYETYVAALSGMFADLSREIASAIPGAPGK
jgi:uncharacterized lipoprotein YmbA